MAQTSTRTYDWQDLADDSVTWADWLQWTGNGTTINGSTGFDDLVYTSGAKDFGVSRLFYALVDAQSVGTHSIKLLISDDDVTYTEVTPNSHTARYVKVKITVANALASAQLTSFDAQFYFDPISESFDDLSISASGTTLPIAQTYGNVTGITGSSARNIQVVLTDETASAPVVTAYDMDTWGKIAVATTATITVTGMPSITTDSVGNVVLA